MQEIYNEIIKKIKLKRRLLLATFIVAVVILTALATPATFSLNNSVIYEKAGIPFIAFILILALLTIAYIFAVAIVLSPMQNSLFRECDPEKYLALNLAIIKRTAPKSYKSIIYVNYMYFSGNYKAALYHINEVGNSPKYYPQLLVLKALNYFYLNEFNLMKATVNQFYTYVSSLKNVSVKKRENYEKQLILLNLLIAIVDGDKEKISEFGSKICSPNQLEIDKMETDYYKGLAAYLTGNMTEALYRFMAVKDKGNKTVFVKYADYYLAEIDNKNKEV